MSDGNKNTRQLKTTAGTVVATYDYDPFGNVIATTGTIANPWKFSSEYYDLETNLVYYNYRYYAPQLGRWISRDPIADEGGLNLYSIATNNTINWTDYIGYFSLRNYLLPGTFEIDIPTAIAGLSIVFTLNISETDCCMKYTISGGMSFSIKKSCGSTQKLDNLTRCKTVLHKKGERKGRFMKKSYDSKFKSRVALEALRGDLTVAEIAGKYQIHPNLVQQWKKKLQESASDVFMTKAERKAENKPYTEDDLMKKIGRLEVENDFLRSVSLALGLNPEKRK